ncbi:MAG: futalosine hydrolase [Proteobacteria bacterium]|nr:futalosine hydrolase [Pseudomonadota bacterium]MBU1057738.1 futalosine hydrolase [Pseudomonadota bacterium]
MFLAACATEFEMQPLRDLLSQADRGWLSLVTGVGIVETTLSLTRYLEQQDGQVSGVLHFGVGGAYVRSDAGGADLLDICLAEEEVFGDFGICHRDRIEPLNEQMLYRQSYPLDGALLAQAGKILEEEGLSYRQGNFVTVCGVSGTARRGAMLAQQYNGICENMEGAAMARVCESYHLPLLELRAISNFVEDRDLERWRLTEACESAGRAAALLLRNLK